MNDNSPILIKLAELIAEQAPGSFVTLKDVVPTYVSEDYKVVGQFKRERAYTNGSTIHLDCLPF